MLTSRVHCADFVFTPSRHYRRSHSCSKKIVANSLGTEGRLTGGSLVDRVRALGQGTDAIPVLHGSLDEDTASDEVAKPELSDLIYLDRMIVSTPPTGGA